MKKADLEKLAAMKVAGRMQQEPHSDRYGAESGHVFDKREQRERDKAAGLVPFAVKLPQPMVSALQALAQERAVTLNDLTAELLGERIGQPASERAATEPKPPKPAPARVAPKAAPAPPKPPAAAPKAAPKPAKETKPAATPKTTRTATQPVKKPAAAKKPIAAKTPAKKKSR